jgi:hypothetical protein
MRYINTYNIHPEDLRKIEIYLGKKGLILRNISKSVNGFAIAHVELIEDPEDLEEQREFNVVIDLQKKICCKFNFYGHRTDGLRIYNQPKIGKLKLFNPSFQISFIESISGFPTPYILITHTDFYYDSEYDDGNYEGKIYATIIDFSATENYNNSACFKFEDCLHYSNSVKVYQIDDEEYPGLFAYSLLSTYDNDYEYYECDDREDRDYDGIWNKTIWCTEKRIIPLDNKSLFEKADEILYEIREERQESEDDYDYDYDYD